MPEDFAPQLDALIREVEKAASEAPDPIAILVCVLRATIQSDADPYLVGGALIEGLASTVAQRIPPRRQRETAEGILRLLHARLETYGFI
ncbi:MAG: hypothetical protein JO264_03035 [Acidisphaera sp.]|nr:hypothetical protein [Acidisphaera sp.]